MAGMREGSVVSCLKENVGLEIVRCYRAAGEGGGDRHLRKQVSEKGKGG